ncbi:MAG: DNA mismatch repair endonuclease MutL [Muribaculaceae bacterium]|jgi:DNA mismatch repair protein MutL|nr:DNA mismatch repair endonuclease MutL [Muribaculaceae bacterium]
MSDIIKLLPDSVANQIAAGEVIQRPSSVIKELVENSIDAGADDIHIILKEAGRSLIQVIDNGKGMSATDARLAFERHSTSKITCAEDLFSLHTMGFRGEALASIAAISQLELKTCRKEDSIGTKLLISASKCEKQEPEMCPVGANFIIKNLFFNVPARRKFLKSNQVELSNIIKEFEKLALVNHNVSFTLVHNDTTIYKLLGGSFKQRIIDLFGRSLDMQLIPLKLDTSLIKIDGFISKPENSRKRNALQYFFVNGRYMRHPYFHKAVLTSYDELIANDVQPNYFLNFTVEPESIDVNIHPTKTEIKFENEAPIWQILSAAVKETLGKFSVVPSIDFDTEDAPEIPAFTNDTECTKPNIDFDPTYNPFEVSKSKVNSGYRSQLPNSLKNWEILGEGFTKNKIYQPDEEPLSPEPMVELPIKDNFISSSIFSDNADEVKNNIICFQLNGKYIVSSVSSGIILVDQHRAHVKVLYERYLKQIERDEIVSQGIMFPVMLHLTPAQGAVMGEITDGLNKLGFNLSHLGGNDWTVNGMPTGVEKLDIEDTILQVIDEVNEGGKELSAKLFDKIALSVARSGAIPYGKKLSNSEAEALVEDLLSLPDPNYTPDGKKVINTLSLEQINKMF